MNVTAHRACATCGNDTQTQFCDLCQVERNWPTPNATRRDPRMHRNLALERDDLTVCVYRSKSSGKVTVEASSANDWFEMKLGDEEAQILASRLLWAVTQ